MNKPSRSRDNDHRSLEMDALVAQSFAKETPEQRMIVERCDAAGIPPINIGPFEGQLLEILLRGINAKTGVEVGTLGGYSASWLARALPAGGKLYSIELEEPRAQLARENLRLAGVSDRAEVLVGDAHKVLKDLDSLKELDFVFIDADKNSYGDYAQWALPRLRKGGLLIADNAYLWGGMLHFGQSKLPQSERYSREQFEGMSACWRTLQSPQLKSLILPTSEGLGVGIKL